MTMIDGDLRDKFLLIFEQLGTSPIKEETATIIQKEEGFKQEERQLVAQSPQATSVTTEDDWSYDIFWCESSGQSAQAQANVLVSNLASKPGGTSGRIRTMELPSSINSKPGYNITGYVIRYGAGEETKAEELRAFLNSELLATGYPGQFEMQRASQVTPTYLSAFICPN